MNHARTGSGSVASTPPMAPAEREVAPAAPDGIPVWVNSVEHVRTQPTTRTVFDQSKIVYLLEGAARIRTGRGTVHLEAGQSMALGSCVWCQIFPAGRIRTWTVFVDEEHLRTQMSWLLPDPRRVIPGVHPSEWDGVPLVLTPGHRLLGRLEPIWRQISVLNSSAMLPEVRAARSIALFARAVEISTRMFLTPDAKAQVPVTSVCSPIAGRTSIAPARGELAKAAELLRRHMDRQWSVQRLAGAVSLSKPHLSRLFLDQLGLPPMRYLSEIRPTEFTRLVEETDLPLAAAAKKVGWCDARVAATWFRRRYGMSPSVFRGHPHPFLDQRQASIRTETSDVG